MIAFLRTAGAVCALCALTVTGGCGGSTAPRLPAPDTIPAMDPAGVESVIFLVGDAGEAHLTTSPTLTRLQQDVEWWSANLPQDSSVLVLNLGDIIYPEGLPEPDAPNYEEYTDIVLGQAMLVGGPAAREKGAFQIFTAGNHDWGLEQDWEGFARLLNLDAYLATLKDDFGLRVELEPEAGSGGPYVIDWGEYFRILVIDTSWWVQLADESAQNELISAVREAMEGADGRSVIIAAHHPFRSAGSHGGTFSFWRTLGFRYVLHRAGAVLQDLTSIPFRQFEAGLRSVFAEVGPPLIFAGGHDHSLQVLTTLQPTDPTISIVSGSGSKLTDVSERDGLLWGAGVPGYVRLVIERDGGTRIFVEGVPAEYLVCPTADPQRTTCLNEGVEAFRTVYWREIR